MDRAKELGLPFSTGLVLYIKLTKDTGIRFREARNYLVRFASIDTDKDGWISAEDLSNFLGVPNDARLQALFHTVENVSL